MSKVTELALTFTRSKVLDGVEVPKATKDYSGRGEVSLPLRHVYVCSQRARGLDKDGLQAVLSPREGLIC